MTIWYSLSYASTYYIVYVIKFQFNIRFEICILARFRFWTSEYLKYTVYLIYSERNWNCTPVYEMYCKRILNEFEVTLGYFSAWSFGLQKIEDRKNLEPKRNHDYTSKGYLRHKVKSQKWNSRLKLSQALYRNLKPYLFVFNKHLQCLHIFSSDAELGISVLIEGSNDRLVSVRYMVQTIFTLNGWILKWSHFLSR